MCVCVCVFHWCKYVIWLLPYPTILYFDCKLHIIVILCWWKCVIISWFASGDEGCFTFYDLSIDRWMMDWWQMIDDSWYIQVVYVCNYCITSLKMDWTTEKNSDRCTLNFITSMTWSPSKKLNCSCGKLWWIGTKPGYFKKKCWKIKKWWFPQKTEETSIELVQYMTGNKLHFFVHTAGTDRS